MFSQNVAWEAIVGGVRRFVILLLLTSCAGTSPEHAARGPTAATPSATGAPAPRPPPGCLWHDELLATVQAGLGSFLRRVEVEPHLVDGKFAGFSIVALRPAAYWKGVDLKPGDIVTNINGMPIERPAEAFAAFTALRSAAELRVSLIRDGTSRQLVYRIVTRGSRPAPQTGSVQTGSVRTGSVQTGPRAP
jgi:hypothetical protein